MFVYTLHGVRQALSFCIGCDNILFMTVVINHFRSVLMGVAVVATLVGLVQAPLTASAMHVSMIDDFDMEMVASDALMTHAFMSMEAHGESDCTSTDCSPEAVCLQHCLEQAVSHDSEAALAPHASAHVPAVTPQRITYPKEDEGPAHADQTFSYTNTRDVLLTTHKRE